MTFAVIEIGGKQYKVSAGQKIQVEKLDVAESGSVVLDKVLLVVDGENVRVGTPYVVGAKVEAKAVKQGKEDTKIVFKYHSKTRYRKKRGHRQRFTKLEIIKISV
jgi:large subunit ribosomal protein L21